MHFLCSLSREKCGCGQATASPASRVQCILSLFRRARTQASYTGDHHTSGRGFPTLRAALFASGWWGGLGVSDLPGLQRLGQTRRSQAYSFAGNHGKHGQPGLG
jgi:hypothetical protein